MSFKPSAARRQFSPLGYAVLGSLLASWIAAGCGGGIKKKVQIPYDAAGAAGESTGGSGNSGGRDVTGKPPGGSGGLPEAAGEGGTGAGDDGDAGAGGTVNTAGFGGTVSSAGGTSAAGAGAMSGGAGSGGAAPTCTANLQTDPQNCGACGRVCVSNAVCTFGHCALGLIKHLNAASGIAVDDTYAYYGNHVDGTISRVPLIGGTAEQIVTMGVTGQQTEMLVLFGSELYWTTYSAQSVLKAPKAGGTATPLSSIEHVAYGIASNGTDVFWANHYQSTNSIGHALVSGATAVNPVIAGTPQVNYPTYVQVDDTYIYWANAGTTGTDGSVYRAKLDGSLPVALAKNQGPVYGIAIDDTTVYFTTTNGLVASVPKSSDGSVAPTTLDQGSYNYNIVVDATDIYWLDEGKNALRHRAKSGTAAETIASTQLTGIDPSISVSTTYLTLDATHVYWVAGFGNGAVISVTRN